MKLPFGEANLILPNGIVLSSKLGIKSMLNLNRKIVSRFFKNCMSLFNKYSMHQRGLTLIGKLTKLKRKILQCS